MFTFICSNFCKKERKSAIKHNGRRIRRKKTDLWTCRKLEEHDVNFYNDKSLQCFHITWVTNILV